jgi:hypothetical protein
MGGHRALKKTYRLSKGFWRHSHSRRDLTFKLRSIRSKTINWKNACRDLRLSEREQSPGNARDQIVKFVQIGLTQGLERKTAFLRRRTSDGF